MSFWMRPYYVATSLLSAKVLEFYQEYWMLLGNKSQPQHYDVVEALHFFINDYHINVKHLTDV
jgi:pentose-5-phosphate-3-epimerase